MWLQCLGWRIPFEEVPWLANRTACHVTRAPTRAPTLHTRHAGMWQIPQPVMSSQWLANPTAFFTRRACSLADRNRHVSERSLPLQRGYWAMDGAVPWGRTP